MIPGVGSIAPGSIERPPSAGPRDGFDAILKREALRFSKHAEDRLVRDGIALNDEDRERLQSGMDRAAAKGAKEALLLLDDKAFIANVREKIVITSMSRDRLKENIFTRIDSAVVL
ncbi:MAG TPA: TIGR02530 family flagellar biosynthesis protein [Elusimicrobiota bacterium]|nr:TIGR02530 family flagellar biosynthesis protein [Elusimicrobiota bacterium]